MLVIGYGNTLRGDDGVGYRVAEAVMEWRLDWVKALPCQQLTPDLAAVIAQAQQVVFVDAAIAPSPASQDVTLELLSLDKTVSFTTHTATPSALLALTRWLYDATPVAYQIMIPAVDFDLGETFSSTTAAGQTVALEMIKNLVHDMRSRNPLSR